MGGGSMGGGSLWGGSMGVGAWGVGAWGVGAWGVGAWGVGAWGWEHGGWELGSMGGGSMGGGSTGVGLGWEHWCWGCGGGMVHELSPSLSVSPPRRKNVHGALANVHKWSPSFVEQVAKQFVELVEFKLLLQVKFADLKFKVSARSIKHQTYTRTAQ